MSNFIKNLLKENESQQLDYKLRINNPFKIAKSIVAFANANGGLLVIGVTDQKEIIGIDPEEELYMLNNALEACTPTIATINQVLIDPKKDEIKILKILVKEGLNKPYGVKQSNGKISYYVRQFDECLPMSKQMIKDLKKGYHFDVDPIKPTKMERRIMNYLEKKSKVTTYEVSILMNISERRARKMLFQMRNKGWIRTFDIEKKEYHSLALI